MSLSPPHFILRERPEGFNPTIQASGCCCIHDNKILLLKRHPKKPQGNTWGVPGGKLEPSETIRDCVVREIREEAGLNIDDEGLSFMGSIYCKIPNGVNDFEYVFHVFHKTFHELPTLDIGLDENVEAKWVTLDEAFQFPLMLGGKEVLDYYRDCFINA